MGSHRARSFSRHHDRTRHLIGPKQPVGGSGQSGSSAGRRLWRKARCRMGRHRLPGDAVQPFGRCRNDHNPNAHHVSQVILAAQAGKHVVSDKPLAIHAADARRALDSCERAGVELGVMFESRLMPCFQEIRQLLVEGELGEILLIKADFSAGKGLTRRMASGPRTRRPRFRV